MRIQWEKTLEAIESDFVYDHRLEGDVELVDVEYDPSAEVVVFTFDVDQEDVERIPDSDSTGTLITY